MEDRTLAFDERGCTHSVSNITRNRTSKWLDNNPHAKAILEQMRVPMTAKQISKKIRQSLKSCCYTLAELNKRGFIACFNPRARRSRLYWLTSLGRKIQTKQKDNSDYQSCMPEGTFVDLDIYGWICYSHRAAVIRALTGPMRPADIKRKAVFRDENLHMSANNVRDVIKAYLEKGIVRPVKIRHKAHTRYELTVLGLRLQAILNEGESV